MLCDRNNSPYLAIGRVAAAACMYFRRFYLMEDFCDYDPRFVGPACLFLACKAEESQVQAKVLFQMLRKVSTTGAEQAQRVQCSNHFLEVYVGM